MMLPVARPIGALVGRALVRDIATISPNRVPTREPTPCGFLDNAVRCPQPHRVNHHKSGQLMCSSRSFDDQGLHIADAAGAIDKPARGGVPLLPDTLEVGYPPLLSHPLLQHPSA